MPDDNQNHFKALEQKVHLPTKVATEKQSDGQKVAINQNAINFSNVNSRDNDKTIDSNTCAMNDEKLDTKPER
jgi:hypothetical protein